jgi:hypothetical protein
VRFLYAVGLCAAIVLAASTAFAGDFMDTWVTFVFADDNINAGPEDRSPEAGFNRVDDEIFFENLDSERRGQETLTQLVLYKKMPSYFKRLDVEAALVIELENWVNEDTWENETRIGDDGSYLKLNYYFSSDDYDGDNISLTAFPIDSQRFLLGYSYEITWGGERIFPGNSGQVPGLRLRTDWGTDTDSPSYAFVGAKTARLLNEDIHERQTYYGFLGGIGLGLTSFMTWEAGGGLFQRGAFPPQGEGTSIGGETVEAYGSSSRLSFHQGMPVGYSVDFKLYNIDPDAAQKIAEPEPYDKGFGWSVAMEGTYLTQNLLSWDDADTTELVPAIAGNLNSKIRLGKFRLHGDVIYKDLSFILFNIPGIAPYRAFPEDADFTPEYFVAGGVDYYFEGPRLTPGVIFGYKQPATFKSGDVVTVYRDENDWETLPANEDPFDIMAAKTTLKWDVAPFFTMAGELRYTLDNNQTKYEKDDGETGRRRVFEDDDVTSRVGFSFLMQARF